MDRLNRGTEEWQRLSNRMPDTTGLNAFSSRMTEKEQRAWVDSLAGVVHSRRDPARILKVEVQLSALAVMIRKSARDRMAPADLVLCRKWHAILRKDLANTIERLKSHLVEPEVVPLLPRGRRKIFSKAA